MAEAARSRLDRWLYDHGVSEAQLGVAHHTARAIRSSVGAALVLRGVLDAEQLTTALSEVYRLPRWDGRVDGALVGRLTLPMCRQALVVPVALTGTRLVLAMADPTKHDVAETAMRACGARDVDVVVGADPSLIAALDEKVPVPDFQAFGAVQLGNLLVLTVLRGRVTAARFRVDVDASLELFEDGRWLADHPLSRPPLRAPVLREIALHLTGMAGMTSIAEEGVGVIHIVPWGSRGWHGGEQCAVDLDLERTEDGMVVVLDRAAVRYSNDENDPRDEVVNQAFSSLDRFHDTVTPTSLTEARRALEVAEEKVRALDGPSGYGEYALRVARARLLEAEGRLLESSEGFEASLECTDVPFGIRAFAMLEVLRFALATERHGWLVAPARELVATALERYGAPGLTVIYASQLVARAHFALGEVDAGEAVASDLARWARAVPPGALYVAWLNGLTHRGRGRLAAAEGELRGALDELGVMPEGMGPAIDGYLHIDLAQVLAAQQRRDEASRILDRAKDRVRDLAPSHAARVAVDRAVAALAGVHPYR